MRRVVVLLPTLDSEPRHDCRGAPSLSWFPARTLDDGVTLPSVLSSLTMHDLVPHERSTDDDPAIFSTANTSPTSPTSPHVPNTPTSNGHEDSARVSPESHDRDLTLGVRHSTFRLSLGYDCAPERHHSQMAWHDVAFRIKSKAILRPMDGVARSGRLLAIMGPSGSGKTTLLHCLAGRRRRMTGSVFVNFLPVTAAVMHRTISFVPQEDHLLGFLTVSPIPHAFRGMASLTTACTQAPAA